MAEHFRLKCFFLLLVFGFPPGMTMAVTGFSSGAVGIAVGIAGIAILIIIFIVVIIAVIRGSNMLQLSPQPVVEVEAENMNLNMPISTVTLEQRSPTAPQPYVMTPGNWIRAMQYGVVALGTQPGYPGDPIQLHSLAAPNLLSAPWCPPVMLSANNPSAASSIPYSQPGAATPVNYTAPHPAQPSTDSHVGVVNPTSQENDIVPPPSYNDVMTGNVKYDKVQEMNPELDQLS